MIRLRQALLKPLAFKVWVTDGDWPEPNTRKPYSALESEIAKDLRARLADLEDISNASTEGLSPGEREALVSRWDERIRHIRELCREVCAVLFIYSEKDDPNSGNGSNRQRIASFLHVSAPKRNQSRGLDILIDSPDRGGVVRRDIGATHPDIWLCGTEFRQICRTSGHSRRRSLRSSSTRPR